MKITQEHYDSLKTEVEKVLNKSKELGVFKNAQEGLKYYEDNNIGKDHKMRFCFDCFYAIPIDWRTPFMDEFYQYGNDDHLYTVLKKILLIN